MVTLSRVLGDVRRSVQQDETQYSLHTDSLDRRSASRWCDGCGMAIGTRSPINDLRPATHRQLHWDDRHADATSQDAQRCSHCGTLVHASVRRAASNRV